MPEKSRAGRRGTDIFNASISRNKAVLIMRLMYIKTSFFQSVKISGTRFLYMENAENRAAFIKQEVLGKLEISDLLKHLSNARSFVKQEQIYAVLIQN